MAATQIKTITVKDQLEAIKWLDIKYYENENRTN